MDHDLPRAAAAPARRTLPLGTRAFVFAVAVLAQAWILALPFQFDDYSVLGAPREIFAAAPASSEGSEMRLPLWLSWSLCHALAGEPLSPLPFHIWGLCLHGFVSVLLARLVARVAPAAFAERAGLLAGLAFGLSAGGIQAVSWTAAQSDVLFPLFGLLAAHALFDARARGARGEGTRVLRARLAAVLWTWLALVSKTPAFLVPVALFALLLAVPPGPHRRGVRLGELACLVLATALGCAARYAYLGTLELRYGALTLPSVLEFPALLPRALGALGQALYPWNQDPAFAGDGPLLARLVSRFDVRPPTMALVIFGAPLAAAAVLERRARAALAAAGLLALLCSAPAALLYSGQATNVVSRTTYFPLLAAWTAVAIACAALCARTRGVGLACTVLAFVVVLDTTVHVARTELLAAAQQTHARAEIARVVDEHAALATGRELVLLAIVSDGGLGGVPCLGYGVVEAHRPPFVAAPGLDVRAFGSFDQALEHLAGATLADRDLALLVEGVVEGVEAAARPGGAPDDPNGTLGTPGARLRADARLRSIGELRPGVATTALGPAVAWSAREDGSSWRVEPPLPAHAVCAVELVFEPGAAEAGELVLARADESLAAIPLELEGSTRTRRVPFETWLTLADALGAPVVAAHWTGRARLAAWPAMLVHVPLLEPLFPGPDAAIELGSDPPRFELALPAGASLPSAARLELRQHLPRAGARAFFGDGRTPLADERRRLVLELTSAHLRREHSPAAGPPADAVAWSAARERLEADLRTRRAYGGEMDWRASLHHPGGHVAARSRFRPGRFVLPAAQRAP